MLSPNGLAYIEVGLNRNPDRFWEVRPSSSISRVTAGMPAQAIPYYLRAGQAASRIYAQQEAIAALGGMATFCATCYGVALIEFRRRRLNDANDVDAIIKKTPMSRQTLLFSATFPDEVRNLSDRYLLHPETVRMHTGTKVTKTVEHVLWEQLRWFDTYLK